MKEGWLRSYRFSDTQERRHLDGDLLHQGVEPILADVLRGNLCWYAAIPFSVLRR